jgi:DNA-binding transcriptional LysR family regulator
LQPAIPSLLLEAEEIENPCKDAELTEICRERSVIVAHPVDLGLSAPSFADLQDAGWVMPVRTTLSNQRTMEALRGHMANFKVVMEINSDAAIRQVVRAGCGVAWLPFKVVEAALMGHTLTEIAVAGIQALRPTFLVRMANIQRSPAARAFDEYVIAQFAASEHG